MIAFARAQVHGPSSWSQVHGGIGSVTSLSSPAPRSIVGPSSSGVAEGAAGFGAVFMHSMWCASSSPAIGAPLPPWETRRTRGMTPPRDHQDRPTSPGEFAAAPAFDLEGTEPLPQPLPQPRDPSDVSAEEVNAELERVGRGIAALRVHGRRLKLSAAADALAAILASVPMTDVWSMSRIVAESLGEPAGKAFEDALLELLRTAKGPPP